MDKQRFKVSDFADKIGCNPKTIYDKLKDPDNKELITEIEVIGGRKINFIITDENQIKYYQKVYGKLPVSEGNYQDTLTENENKTSEKSNMPIPPQINFNDIFDKIITLNEDHSLRIQKFTEELAQAKGTQLLLEDKQGREGLLIQEIRDLKKEKSDQIKLFTYIITVITLILMLCLSFIFYKFQNPTIIKETNTTQIIKEMPAKVTKPIPTKQPR